MAIPVCSPQGHDPSGEGLDFGLIAECADEEHARLLAAATEMYTVLKCLFGDERFRVGIGGNPIAVERLIAQGHAAITKAEGNSATQR